mgnify:CR=1 FL=1
MITIIDYGMGNLGSLLNMIKHVGGEAKITSSIDEISEAKKIILPGVGRMDTGMKILKKTKIDQAIYLAKKNINTKILGVCLGMHLLFDTSEEGNCKGLGLVSGKVKKFKFKQKTLKVPHMGWNSINFKKESNLFSFSKEKQYYYFVHSYYVECKNSKNIVATCNYGHEFTCALEENNIFGVQFHPEKSHAAGKKLCKKFIQL